MNDIALITPPDFLYNDSFNLLVVCSSNVVKDQLHKVLVNTTIPLNVLMYETPTDVDHNIEWLMTAVKMADCVILDVDNCDPITRQFASHIIAQSKTFYLTNDGHIPYNLISNGRVYDFAWLETYINRGTNA